MSHRKYGVATENLYAEQDPDPVSLEEFLPDTGDDCEERLDFSPESAGKDDGSTPSRSLALPSPSCPSKSRARDTVELAMKRDRALFEVQTALCKFPPVLAILSRAAAQTLNKSGYDRRREPPITGLRFFNDPDKPTQDEILGYRPVEKSLDELAHISERLDITLQYQADEQPPDASRTTMKIPSYREAMLHLVISIETINSMMDLLKVYAMPLQQIFVRLKSTDIDGEETLLLVSTINAVESRLGISVTDIIEVHRRVSYHYREYQTCLNDIVMLNYGLIASAAKNRRDDLISYDDMLQEGYFGLNRAAEKFNWRLGYMFSTYALTWIVQAIQRAQSDKGRIIRLPQNFEKHLRAIEEIDREYQNKSQTGPSDEVFLEKLGITSKRLNEIRTICHNALPLNPVTDDGGRESSLIDVIVDTNTTRPEDIFAYKELQQILHLAVKSLPDKESMAISLYYFNDCTLNETANEMRVTTETARSYLRKGIKTLMESVPDIQNMIPS
jgi:RNA polymerase sigma factor (sigma-70 family)